MLIIPDIHGRTFWREPVTQHFARLATDASELDRKVVFLGDYFDPYPIDDITPEMVVENMRNILQFKHDYPDDVVLLLGNHDLPYIFQDIILSSRFDDEHKDEYTRLLCDNLECFQMVYTYSISNRLCIFSHAGILPAWMKRYLHTSNILQAVEMFDRPVRNMTNEMIKQLNRISYLRGGNDSVGSMIWADVDEFAMDDNDPDVMQIFGHTQQTKDPIITDSYACLDCRKVFSLDESSSTPQCLAILR